MIAQMQFLIGLIDEGRREDAPYHALPKLTEMENPPNCFL